MATGRQRHGRNIRGHQAGNSARDVSALSLSQGRNRSDYTPMTATQRKIVDAAIAAVPAGRALKVGAKAAKAVDQSIAKRVATSDVRALVKQIEKNQSQLAKALGKGNMNKTEGLANTAKTVRVKGVPNTYSPPKGLAAKAIAAKSTAASRRAARNAARKK